MSPAFGGKVAVQEGSPVTLSCSAQITCPLLPPTFSWAPSLGDAKEEVTATWVTSVLTFNASFRHHREKIICSSLYKRQAGHSDISFEKRRTINVLYPPTNVSVEWPPGPVRAGSYVNLRCKCSANPSVKSYAWYRSRLHPGPDQRPDQTPLGFNQNVRVLVSEDTQFYCRVRNLYGAQNSSLTQMDVHYPPTNVSVEWPPGPVRAGSYVNLRCKCSANPSVKSYAWYRSRLHPGPDQRPDQTPLGFNQNVRVLVSEDTQFYCRVRNLYGAQNSSLTQMDVHSFHVVSLLIGSAAGAVVMMLLWALFHVTFCRKKRGQLSEETSELVRAEQMEVVYASMAAQGGGEGEDLHYVDVRFVMLHSPLASNPDIIRGLDSKTAVYAQIRPHQTESGNGEPREENIYAETVSSGRTGAGEEVMAERSLSDAKDFGGNLVTGQGTNFDP
ncbi:hypothetical protein CRUP_003933 [Coryphaenoides rupestris]|nr:hypothetical protein CRUP_003933 [Coryphaenoides rupestris]